MRRTIGKDMEEGNMEAVHNSILNHGTMGRGGEDLSVRRAEEAALFARDGFEPTYPTTNIITDPVRIQLPHLGTSDIVPASRVQSLCTLYKESTSETSKLAWEKDNYSGRTPSRRVGGGDVFGTVAVGGAVGVAAGGAGTFVVGSTTVTVGVVASSTGPQIALSIAVLNPLVALGMFGTLVVVGIGAGVIAACSEGEND